MSEWTPPEASVNLVREKVEHWTRPQGSLTTYMAEEYIRVLHDAGWLGPEEVAALLDRYRKLADALVRMPDAGLAEGDPRYAWWYEVAAPVLAACREIDPKRDER